MFTVLLMTSHVSFADSVLNGLAKYEALGTTKYVAALYLTETTQRADSILRADAPTRMVIRITASKITPRRFLSTWVANLSVNTSNQEMAENIEHLSKFNALLQNPLYRGDLIEFHYTPEQKLNVSINDTLLGNISSRQFSQMLLRTWVGDVPVSSTFRSQLLAGGNYDRTTNTLFTSYTPGPSRIEQVKLWLSDSTDKDTSRPEAPSDTEQRKSAAVASSSELIVHDRQPTNISQVATDSPLPNTRNTAQVVAISPGEKRNRENTAPNLPADDQSLLQSSVPKSSEKSAASNQTTLNELQNDELDHKQQKPESTDENTDENAALSEAELIVFEQYYRAARAQIVKYKTMPRKAFQRRAEGELRLEITVNRAGNVTYTRVIEPSQHEMFQKQALDAVAKASPLPAIPNEIAGETLTFTLAMRYELPR